MTRILLIAAAALLCAAAVFFILWRAGVSRRRQTEAELSAAKKALSDALACGERARAAERITADNRREADEKIDALRGGDALGNALDGLRDAGD